MEEDEPDPKPEGFLSELVAREAMLGKQSLGMMKGLLVLASTEDRAAPCTRRVHDPVPLAALQERAIERGEVRRPPQHMRTMDGGLGLKDGGTRDA